MPEARNRSRIRGSERSSLPSAIALCPAAAVAPLIGGSCAPARVRRHGLSTAIQSRLRSFIQASAPVCSGRSSFAQFQASGRTNGGAAASQPRAILVAERFSKTRTLGGSLLGVFAKIPDQEPVKTRLQLSVSDSTRFHLASLADVLETACRVVERPVLFVSGVSETPARSNAKLGDDLVAAGLPLETWRKIRIAPQQGEDLGARMEAALASLLDDGARAARGGARPAIDSRSERASPRALLLGSDSPSLSAERVRTGLRALDRADVVLGPATDGGFWSIGVTRAPRGFLTGLPWSASDT